MHDRSRCRRNPAPAPRRRLFFGTHVIGCHGDSVSTGPNRNGPGEADGEGRALSRRAGDVDRAALGGGDGEPRLSADPLPGPSRVGPPEACEDALLRLGRDARSLAGDDQFGILTLLATHAAVDRSGNGTWRRQTFLAAHHR